jgi:hypothetical protein
MPLLTTPNPRFGGKTSRQLFDIVFGHFFHSVRCHKAHIPPLPGFIFFCASPTTAAPQVAPGLLSMP